MLQLDGSSWSQLAASAAEGGGGHRGVQAAGHSCAIIAMPDEDGYTFIRKLRATRSTEAAPSIPARSRSRRSAAEADRPARRSPRGFQLPHLAKPIDIDRLRWRGARAVQADVGDERTS